MSDYQQHIESRFKGLQKAELREACKVFGATVGPNEGEESMRKKLCQAAGVPFEDAEESPKPKLKTVGGVPNLSPNGPWGGKCYIVKIKTTIKGCKSCPVGWNGLLPNLPLDKEVKLPAPLYHSLKSAIETDNATHQAKVENDDGTHRFVTIMANEPDFVLTMDKVDPETAHLPESYREYFTNLAGKTDSFATYNRRQIQFIFTTLFDYVRADAIREMTDADMREKVLIKLGLLREEDLLGLEVA